MNAMNTTEKTLRRENKMLRKENATIDGEMNTLLALSRAAGFSQLSQLTDYLTELSKQRKALWLTTFPDKAELIDRDDCFSDKSDTEAGLTQDEYHEWASLSSLAQAARRECAFTLDTHWQVDLTRPLCAFTPEQ